MASSAPIPKSDLQLTNTPFTGSSHTHSGDSDPDATASADASLTTDAGGDEPATSTDPDSIFAPTPDSTSGSAAPSAAASTTTDSFLSSLTTTPSTSLSVSAAPEATSAMGAVTVTSDSTKVNGLIAGCAVLGALFLITLGILIYTLLRKRKPNMHTVDSSTPSMEEKRPLDPSLSGLERTVAALETQLHEKEGQLRDKQAALLQIGRSPSAMSLSDAQVRDRFGKLRSGINDWVTSYFDGCAFAASPSPEVIATLKRSQPYYEALLQDRSMVKLVLRGLVADMICQAFASGQLLGNEAFWELKQSIGARASAAEAHEWRALTSRLLEKTAGYRSDRSEAVEDLSHMIDSACANLTNSKPLEQRKAVLEQLVDAAATLALDLSKQRAMFKMEQPAGSTFNPETMEPAEPMAMSIDDAARPVKAVVFPYVARWGSEKGSGYERSVGILKAQVLI